MTKIQPALFALQANEKELHQLITQLMQSPFFYQEEQAQENDWSYTSFSSPLDPTEMLQLGHIRIALPLDTAIYTLLRSFCAKTAKQAEAIINTLMTTHYTPVRSYVSLPQMPPIIFQSTMAKPRHPQRFTISLKRMNGKSTVNPGNTEKGAKLEIPLVRGKNVSESSISSEYSTTTSETSKSASSLLSDSPSSGSLHTNIGAENTPDDTFGEEKPPKSPPTVTAQKARRKTSRALERPHSRLSSSSDFSDYDVSMSQRRIIPDQSTWNTSIIDNNMIVSQYGETLYPLLMWNPKLKLDVQLKSSIGLLCGTVTGVDPAKPVVSLKLINITSSSVAFSIRSYRQSAIFSSHVVYPTKGLHVLGKDQCWEDNVEFYPNVKEQRDIFVIDIFMCKIDDHPSWNILRRYAVMRGAPR